MPTSSWPNILLCRKQKRDESILATHSESRLEKIVIYVELEELLGKKRSFTTVELFPDCHAKLTAFKIYLLKYGTRWLEFVVVIKFIEPVYITADKIRICYSLLLLDTTLVIILTIYIEFQLCCAFIQVTDE